MKSINEKNDEVMFKECSWNTFLNDGTLLEQRGIGSAKILLNGKIILLRNVLHIPALHEPIYSLRHHQMMPHCGYFSSYETGSHLLFPTFVL
jgi:hypothetical protein